jgi:hypothetical protein
MHFRFASAFSAYPSEWNERARGTDGREKNEILMARNDLHDLEISYEGVR